MKKNNLALDHTAKLLKNIVFGLIYLYILTISFQTLGFRLKGLYIGLPEIIFFVLAPLAIIHVKFSGQKFWIDKFDLFVFGWLITNILAGWYTGFDSIVVLEIIKTAYLVVLYMVLKWTITPGIIEKIIKAIILSSLIATLTGVIGFRFGYINIDTSLTIKRAFPYLTGNIFQAKGFTSSPNMLASIIMIGILLQFKKINSNQSLRKIYDIFFLAILILGFTVTFSKTVICLLIGIILTCYSEDTSLIVNIRRLPAGLIITILFIFNILSTHLTILEKPRNPGLLKGDYIGGPVILDEVRFSIYPTGYWLLKKISIQAVNQFFPWGLGPGKFNKFAFKTNMNDEYPTFTPYPDPHSTYLGTLAEFGLLGFFALAGMIFMIKKRSKEVSNFKSNNESIFSAIPIIFIVAGIEAISTDIMNFRHYWILLSLLSVISNHNRILPVFKNYANRKN